MNCNTKSSIWQENLTNIDTFQPLSLFYKGKASGNLLQCHKEPTLSRRFRNNPLLDKMSRSDTGLGEPQQADFLRFARKSKCENTQVCVHLPCLLVCDKPKNGIIAGQPDLSYT